MSVSNPRGAAEYVTVTNTGAEAVNLNGWRILSYSGSCALVSSQTFTFTGGYTLNAGASVNVYSGYGNNPPGGGLRGDSGNIWNDDKDKAELTRPDGTVVATYAYGGC